MLKLDMFEGKSETRYSVVHSQLKSVGECNSLAFEFLISLLASSILCPYHKPSWSAAPRPPA